MEYDFPPGRLIENVDEELDEEVTNEVDANDSSSFNKHIASFKFLFLTMILIIVECMSNVCM